jgi:hypothetical protein
MLTQTRRFAMVTAMLWFGFGVGDPAEAGPILPTPAGLSPGDQFRFVFVTDGTTAAFSANISDYNNFVTEQANGAIYNGSIITWVAIASTPTVDAIENVGQTETPVYLPDGVMVTTSTTPEGLWSGTLGQPINEDISAEVIVPRGLEPFDVWTGTLPTGFGSPDQQLGTTISTTPGVSTPAAITGDADFTTGGKWTDFGSSLLFTNKNTTYSLYGISQVLTVPVPEPSALGMLGTGIIAVLAYGWSCHRRDRRRQRPGVHPPDATE